MLLRKSLGFALQQWIFVALHEYGGRTYFSDVFKVIPAKKVHCVEFDMWRNALQLITTQVRTTSFALQQSSQVVDFFAMTGLADI